MNVKQIISVVSFLFGILALVIAVLLELKSESYPYIVIGIPALVLGVAFALKGDKEAN